MATAINANYFTATIFLPNTDPAKAEGQQLLAYISQFEPIFLEKVFGVDLATLVQSEIDSPTGVGIISEIVNGIKYTNTSGVKKNWIGLKNAKLLSPIANYVYYQIQQSRDTSTTGIGEMMQQTQNATRTNAGAKTTTAWNQMVEWLLNLNEFIEVSKPTYAQLSTYVTPLEMLTTTTRFSL